MAGHFYFGLGDLRAWIVTLDGFSFLFCTCWYLYIALNNPEFFRGVNSELKPIADIIPKQKSSAVINDEKQANRISQRFYDFKRTLS